MTSNDPERIGLGGGCHWCTEAVFTELRAVEQIEQGFVQSTPPHDSWSEAVLVTFNPVEIPLPVLIDIHLRTHASTSNHSMRSKYRSAVYVFSTSQDAQAEAALTSLQTEYTRTLVTRVLPFVAFKSSHERYHNYYQSHAGGEFYTRFIDPKLDKLRAEYGRYL